MRRGAGELITVPTDALAALQPLQGLGLGSGPDRHFMHRNFVITMTARAFAARLDGRQAGERMMTNEGVRCVRALADTQEPLQLA